MNSTNDFNLNGNCLNLTLTKTKNILDGITLYEPIDISILDKLINSTLLKETFRSPICQTLYHNEKTQLIKYRGLIENGRAKVQYNKYENNPYGRSNPDGSLSLFTIRREIRHTLAGDSYEDVDIDYCHHAILEQIIINNNYECPNLTNYINNRAEWLKLVQEHYKLQDLPAVKSNPALLKDYSKNLFIRILFSGGVYQWKKDYNIPDSITTPQKINDFENEIKEINKIIADNNPELVEIIKNVKIEQKKMDADGFVIQTKEEKEQNKPKRKYNLNGSVSSYFLQEKEITILQHVFIYCKEKDYIKNDNVVLCADGLMLEKHLYKPQLLGELKEVIKQKTGFNLNFSNKPMDQGYNKILDKSLNFDLYHPTFTTGLLADYFRIIYANKFINVNGQVYNYNGVFWKKEEDKKNATLHNFVDSVYYKHLINYISNLISLQNTKIGELEDNENNKPILNVLREDLKKMGDFLQNVNYQLRSVKKRKEIVEDIINKITCNYIEFDKNPHYFTFKNKIYDLQNNKWVEPKYNQYLMMNTGWDWCDYYQENDIKELDKIIDTIFPIKAVKEHYLTALSTGLYGQQIEKIFIATGRGGNGKSLINGLMMTATGEYGYKLPSNILLNEIKEGANPAVANMHNKRFILTQEPDGKKRICSSTAKEITGDPILNCRGLYSSNTTTKLLLSLFLECNDLPKMDEVNDGVTRRIDTTPFISKFVDPDTYNSLSEEERKEKNIMLGNPYYKTEEFKQKYKQALIIILFEYFNKFKNNNYTFKDVPKECKEVATDYMAVSDDIYNWFSEFFEKETEKDDKNVIFFDDLYELFTSSNLYLNMTKKDKQNYNLKQFTKKINDNVFLQQFIKPRDTTYNKIKYKKPYIIGFKKIVKDKDEEDEKSPFDI